MAKKTRAELWGLVRDIKGFLSEREAYFLYEHGYKAPPAAAIVEIGSFCGKSTVCIALGLKDNENTKARIYAIDTFTGSSEHGEIDTYGSFMENLKKAGADGLVVPVRAASEDAFRGWDKGRNFNFLWIDGGHEYEFVSDDINSWLRYLSINGVMAIHDTGGVFRYGNFMGVRRALLEHVFTRECLKDYGFVDSITYATKVHNMTPMEWWSGRIAQFYWWVGECGYYGRVRGLGRLSFIVRVIKKYFKRIPKEIRKPWLLLATPRG